MGSFIDTLENRKALQKALMSAGYSVGAYGADGKLGGDTAKAIRAYRRDHGLSDAAVIDNTLLRLLGLGPALITEPGTSANVAFQLILAILTKGQTMKWSTIEQLIRILAYSGGSYFLGDAVANGDMYKAAVGGLISLGAFLWWLVFERNRVQP